MVFTLLVTTFLFMTGMMALVELAGASASTTQVAFAVFVFASCVAIAIRCRTMDVGAFFRTYRRIPEPFDAMGGAANAVVGLLLAFVAAGGSFADPGFASIVAGWCGGLFILAVAIAAPLRASGATTLPDFLALRFASDAVRLCAAVIVVAVAFGLLVSQTEMAGSALGQLTGMTPAAAIWWTIGLLAVCTTLGGMRSIAWIQVALFLVMVTSLATSLLFDTAATGALPAGSSGAGRGLPLAALSLCMMLGTLAMPHIASRPLASRSPTTAGRSAVGILLITAALAVVLPAIEHRDAGPMTGLGLGVGLELTARFAAAAAVAAGMLAMMSAAIGHDLRFRATTNGAPDPVRLLMARLAVIVIAVAAAMVAGSRESDPVSDMIWTFSLAAASLAVPLLGGLWWRRANAAGALASMVLGLGVQLGVTYQSELAGLAWTGNDPAVAGIAGAAASLLGLIAASLVTSAPDAQSHRRFDALHVSGERPR